jgi:hypothetical protein
MRRDWTNHGRVSPTAKYVNGRWHQLGNGDGLYQPLRERLMPYQADITGLVDANQPLNAPDTATPDSLTVTRIPPRRSRMGSQ